MIVIHPSAICNISQFINTAVLFARPLSLSNGAYQKQADLNCSCSSPELKFPNSLLLLKFRRTSLRVMKVFGTLIYTPKDRTALSRSFYHWMLSALISDIRVNMSPDPGIFWVPASCRFQSNEFFLWSSYSTVLWDVELKETCPSVSFFLYFSSFCSLKNSGIFEQIIMIWL